MDSLRKLLQRLNRSLFFHCILVDFLQKFYKFILQLQNVQDGVSLETVGTIVNIRWRRQVNMMFQGFKGI